MAAKRVTKVAEPTASIGAKKSVAAVRFRPELHERLKLAAEDRDLSVNFLINKAVEDFLDRLIPADQLKFTRD